MSILHANLDQVYPILFGNVRFTADRPCRSPIKTTSWALPDHSTCRVGYLVPIWQTSTGSPFRNARILAHPAGHQHACALHVHCRLLRSRFQAHMVFSSVMGASPGPKMEFVLYGTEATLRLDLDAKRLSIATKAGTWAFGIFSRVCHQGKQLDTVGPS
jgi:hypothetical protein